MNQPVQDLGTLRKSERIGGLVYLPMFLFGAPFLAYLIVTRFSGMIPNEEMRDPINLLIYNGLNAVALCLIFRHYLAEQFRRIQSRGWHIFGDLLLSFLVFYGVGILSTAARTLLQELFQTEYQNANQDALLGVLEASPAILILSACVLAPIAEELLFRGLIFCGLYRKSRILAYALSILAFSFAHVYGSMFRQPIPATLVTMTAYLPHSFALAWSYARSGSIWSSVFLHASLNALSLLLIHTMT